MSTWYTDDERRIARDLRQTNYALLPFLFACILFIALHFSRSQMTAAATALIWAAGCLISGAAIGFIFSIPRVVATVVRKENGNEGEALSETGAVKQAAAREATAQQYQVNSNLVEISDWLTKIIVGLGLVNLREIPASLTRMANALAQGLGNASCPQQTPCTDYAFAMGLIVTFAVLGFLMGYLYTRLFLAGAFRRADDSMLRLREEVSSILRQEGVSQTGKELGVTPAQIEAAVRVRESPFANRDGVALAELNRLAREYELVRLTMLRGPNRTRRMTEVVTLMRALALAAYGNLERFINSGSAGERLAAVAMLQVKPSAEYWDWLLERVGIEKPFIGYQALEALRRAVEIASGTEREALSTTLRQYAQSPRGLDLKAAQHDRGQLFRKILQMLDKDTPAESDLSE
jgi:hypothetical protein